MQAKAEPTSTAEQIYGKGLLSLETANMLRKGF
jgi:hypothetical protein